MPVISLGQRPDLTPDRLEQLFAARFDGYAGITVHRSAKKKRHFLVRKNPFVCVSVFLDQAANEAKVSLQGCAESLISDLAVYAAFFVLVVAVSYFLFPVVLIPGGAGLLLGGGLISFLIRKGLTDDVKFFINVESDELTGRRPIKVPETMAASAPRPDVLSERALQDVGQAPRAVVSTTLIETSSTANCRGCGRPLAPLHKRCPVCGKLRSVNEASSPSINPVSERPSMEASVSQASSHRLYENDATHYLPLPRDPAQLILLGSSGPSTYDLGISTLIGRRREENDIALGDPGVSRRHGVVVFDGTAYSYQDTGSLNGSWLIRGGVRERINQPMVLQEGDQLMLGTSRLAFRAPARGTAQSQVARGGVP